MTARTTHPAGSDRRLRNLELAITRRLDGLLQGDYQGLLPGLGSEPGEGREYRAGDDVRRIDWNLTARTTVPHVRDTIADRELSTWVLVDGSASVAFGTAQCEKWDLAIAAVAAVGFLTTRPGNRIGAVVARPGSVERVPPRGGRDGVLALLHRLHSAPRPSDGEGPVDLEAAVRGLDTLARRRGLAVVVSDFIGPATWHRPLRALAARHQVLAVEVCDQRDAELPAVGMLSLVDPETGARLTVQTSKPALRERFAQAARAQRRDVETAIRRAGADHLVLATDRDWVRDLARHVLTARRRRHMGAGT